jgi:MFS family permease
MSGSNVDSRQIDSRQEESAFAYPGWRVALASGAGVLVSFGSLLVYTFGIFLKPLTEEFGWSRQAAALSFGIAAMTLAACSPPLGYLLDRVGARRVILPCMIVFGCAFASLALLTGHLWQLYAIFAILGAVGNGNAHLAYTRAVSTWFDRRRGMALALVMTGGAVGSIVLPPAAQSLIQGLGWRGAFGVLGGLVLAVGLPVVVPLVRERPGVDRGSRVATEGASVAQAMRSRAFWILIVVLFSFSIGQNGALTHFSALLTDRVSRRTTRPWRFPCWARQVCWGDWSQAGYSTAFSLHAWLSACLRWAPWGSLSSHRRIRWRWACWRRFWWAPPWVAKPTLLPICCRDTSG